MNFKQILLLSTLLGPSLAMSETGETKEAALNKKTSQSSQASLNKKISDKFSVKIELINKSSLGTYHKSIDVAKSHMGGTVSNYKLNIDEYIRSLGGNVSCAANGTIATLGFRLSSTALIVGNKTLESVEEEITHKVDLGVELKGAESLAEQRMMLDAAAEHQLDLALEPLRGLKSVDQLRAMRAQFKPTVLDGIANTFGLENFEQLNFFMEDAAEKEMAKMKSIVFVQQQKKAKKRLRYVQLDSGIRSIYVGFGSCFGGNFFVYGKIGKFNMGLSAEFQDSTGSTELDDLRPQRSTTQAAMGSMPTTGVNAGSVYIVNEDITIRSDFYIFHAKPPISSGQNMTAQVLNMSDRDYKEYKKFWKLNSYAARILMKNRHVDVYFSVGSFDDKMSYGTGTTIRITPLNKIQIFKDTESAIHFDYVNSDRGYIEESYSLFLTHKRDLLGKTVTFYIGFENSRGSTLAGTVMDPAKYKTSTAGVNVKILDLKYRGIEIYSKVYFEGSLRDIDERTGFDAMEVDNNIEGLGFEAGGQIGARY